jgi:hypothetical protein
MRCYNAAMNAFSVSSDLVMLAFGKWDLIIILVVATLLIGTRLPGIMRSFRDGPPRFRP